MMTPDGTHRSTDAAVFAACLGARAVIERFGFVPTFHDAELERLEVGHGAAQLVLGAFRAFRATGAVDADGFLGRDGPIRVGSCLSGVTGIRLAGDATAIIAELGLRRIGVAPPGFETCGSPGAWDSEVAIESSYGLQGSIHARDVRLSLEPA